ncbi:MAG: hypothetical protein HY738_10735 [Bacteroidia bacterium]|nr:hypothetical protein [Bacteroidia bacterium]
MITCKKMTNFTGKPYAGKLHVRIDEGVGKAILPSPLYSTGKFGHYGQTLISNNEWMKKINLSIK